ncbi:hypothetical protein A2U01_0068032, partial [Trifolium medium]|nr:hypothetical protein [Trifolium medium]
PHQIESSQNHISISLGDLRTDFNNTNRLVLGCFNIWYDIRLGWNIRSHYHRLNNSFNDKTNEGSRGLNNFLRIRFNNAFYLDMR